MDQAPAEQLLLTLRSTFQQMNETTDAMERFMNTNQVIRLVLEDSGDEILVDGRLGEVFWDKRPGRADLELLLPAGLLHEIMMETRSFRQSFMQGAIRSKGNAFRAMPFAELLETARPIYQSLVQAAG